MHRASGDEYEFSTRSAFYGHHLKKAGGWLAEYNAAKQKEENKRKPEEFDITDVQIAEPLSNCLHTLKRQIDAVKETLDTKLYYGYSGKGKTFRDDVATILGYKANRIGAMRPLHLDSMKEYLVKNHACEIVEEVEADDACSIDSYTAWQKWSKSKSDNDKLILVAIDKDAKGTTCHLYNPNKANSGVDSHSGFGGLWLDSKGSVDGRGRMWFYFQVLYGDSADNYSASSAVKGMKWGEKAAYDLLKNAKNDKEAFEALLKGYRTLYPRPKEITGHKGDTLIVDALYVMQENATLAHMLRWRGDKVDVKEVMGKLGVKYE